MTLSLKQLRYFQAVVDTGSYSQAAERLFVAQSAISRQIKELEEAAQVTLLKRTTRNVTLTPAGEVFYKGCGKILEQLQETLAEARYIERGGQETMRLLHSSSVPLTGILLTAIETHLQQFPDINCEVGVAGSESQATDIEERRADIGFVRLPLLRRTPNLVITPLYHEALLVALPAGHRLSQSPTLAIEALQKEVFVSVPHRDRGGLSRRVADLCLNAGFFPPAARALSRKTSQLNLVAAGLGIAVVPACMCQLAPPDVVFVPLAGEQATSTVAVIHHRDAPPMIASFIATVRTLAGHA